MKDGWYEFPWMHVDINGEKFLSLVLIERIEFNKHMCLIASIYDINEENKIKRLVKQQTKEIIEQNRVLVKLKNELKAQNLLARDANPLTGLPGNNTIKKYLQNSIIDRKQRSILYVDLDNFKAYNDKYGFVKGDEVLIKTAEILTHVGQRNNIQDYFVGNIGGDDFVVILDSKYMSEIVKEIIEEFDRSVLDYYNETDVKRGLIISKDREGVFREFPIMGISIAGVNIADVPELNYIEVCDICSEIKREAKLVSGSCFMFY